MTFIVQHALFLLYIIRSYFKIADTRYTIHDTRYTIHDTRYTIHDTRYTIHDTRYTIHDTRYTIHSKLDTCMVVNQHAIRIIIPSCQLSEHFLTWSCCRSSALITHSRLDAKQLLLLPNIAFHQRKHIFIFKRIRHDDRCHRCTACIANLL